ncbi:hypothetical protein [uncultured Imperialibacter sp.]|uniref:hypothetical protein n=1 Tax=uncultured Imperialibacter sp. TaxID=1672639 RepID=UPI0030DCC00F|tara:strand:+ start:17700 stop:17903 length:204 start_codon:yes stop_codon:yes gene_type:complete
MRHLIEINDSLPGARQLLELIKTLNIEGISFIDLEEQEDKVLLSMMEEDKQSGLADKTKVLNKLGLE